MREEDLKNLPQSIEAWKVREFLESLGIRHSDVFDMHVGVRSVEVSMYASDEKGHRYRGPDGKTVAQHTIAIPFVGSWDKPADAPKTTDRMALGRWLYDRYDTRTAQWPWEELSGQTREQYAQQADATFAFISGSAVRSS